MTFTFPNVPQLTLWELACAITEQNSADLWPNRETRNEISLLATAIYTEELWAPPPAGSTFTFLIGFIADSKRADSRDDWHRLKEITVQRESWEKYIKWLTTFSPDCQREFLSAPHWNEQQLTSLCFGLPPGISYRHGQVGDAEYQTVQKKILVDIETGRLHAEIKPTGNRFFGQWNIEPAVAVRWALLNGFDRFPDWLAAPHLAKINLLQDAERRALGRYVLEEAALAIADAGGRYETVLMNLIAAATAHVLPVHRPGEFSRHVFANGREAHSFYEEAYWDDLNEWLELNEKRIDYRFPKPPEKKDAHLDVSRLSDTDGVFQVTTVRNMTARSTPLNTEIEEAKRLAPNPSDIESLWGELTKLAEKRVGVLVGYSSDGVQYRGKEYEASQIPDVFTKKNLRDRISGAKKRAKARGGV